MLVQIGQRPRATDVVDFLYECHGRIRRFVNHAHALAFSSSNDEREIRGVAEQIVRYFTTAFPLHVADENNSIFPRLAGRAESLDAALAQMRADHGEHEGLDRLVAICQRLAREPRQLAAVARDLAATTEQLTLDLEAHLSLEELTIFPVVRDLPGAVRATIHAEMRARRDSHSVDDETRRSFARDSGTRNPCGFHDPTAEAIATGASDAPRRAAQS